ncbi:uncharacterized protein [Mytilus edulis]|uniref:uncharacterized protein n=1 Tax=Mytilus edulis TaxID=6550 RepID=UPI0039EF95C5
MDMFILLTLLQMLSLNEAYNFTCPSQAHWNLRAKSMCKPERNYTCLFNVTFGVNVYNDTCNRPRLLSPGHKYVFQPNLNRATCSATRYQPFNFDTIGHSDCTFQKTLCNSLGQETYDDGNTTVDRKCICNTDRRYSFVKIPKNKCYCDPLIEDCSCYLVNNRYNKTNDLTDIKCYYDTKMTRLPYLREMFNSSRTIKIIEFDSFKYNLNYPTNRNKAAISIVTLLLAYFAVCIVVYIINRPGIQFCRESLKVTNRNDHLTAIKDGTEIRRYVRIQVIGKEGVGKSSLVRRLVGDSNMKVHSTDGIDIVRKCQIRTTDGEWVIGKVETERNKIMRRIQEAVRNEPKQSEPVSDQVIPCGGENNKTEAITSNESLPKFGRKQENESHTKDKLSIALPGSNTVEHSLTGEIKVNIGDNLTIVEEKSEIDIPYENDGDLSRDIKRAEYLVNTDDMKKKITEQMDKILLEIQKDQDKMTSESLVECGLWDFAGQKDYYATHQTFLNPHAIYLLVTNILDDLTTIENETDFDSIEEYIDFWFDSIHCLNTSSSDIRPTIPKGYSKHRLYPPVIVVCTHIDEYKTVGEFEKRKTEYIERFEEIFGGEDKANHNRGIHFISNTELLERDCKKLKDKIYEVANETMFFEEELPTQWIQLENALSVLKHESKQTILSFQNFVELSQITFIEEKELLPFLTYQHKIGNIIFFDDIREYIILQPEWLVKCFRCLVCDDHEFKRNHAIVNSTDWQHLKKTGQLSDDIIDRLFEKELDLEFGKYKNHILHVMEKFDILVKPKFKDTKDDSSLIPNSYYMPCMIKQQSTSLDIIKKMFEGERSSFSFSPWLILEFKFLPLAYFNHILFYYITRYTVCEKARQKTLYRGKTLVNLDKTGLRKLCICFSKNAIALHIWKLIDVEDNTYSTILVELCRKIKELKKKLRQSISYDIKAKCSNGDYFNKEGRITLKKLGEMCENGHYLCPEHNEMHSKDDVEKTWLQHADIVIAKLNKEHAENNPRNIVGN